MSHEPTSFPMSWDQAVDWLCTHEDPQKRALAHACYFDGTASEAAKRFSESDEWKAIRDMLPATPLEGGRALDLGAGRGISSYALATEGWHVDALDPYPSAQIGLGAITQISLETGLPISVIEAFAEDVPRDDATYDVVHCRQALHHAADLKMMCSEAMRVLKPGGVFLATREHVLTREEDLPIFLNNHPLHHLYGGENAFTLAQYEEALRAPNPSKVEIFSPRQTAVNMFPSSAEEERRRIARISGVTVDEVPDFAFRLVDHYDSQPGRLYSFRVTK